MAIKINGENMYKRIINGREVQKVMTSYGEIRPNETPPLYAPGIYWNQQSGLITASYNGFYWFTIADKNLGATQVYNYGDTLSEANCGKLYQWGNNYGFPYSGATSTTSTKVTPSGQYGPGNYYSSSDFVTSSTGWLIANGSSDVRDMWGGYTNTVASKQGPCPSGFHIGNRSEYRFLRGYYGGDYYFKIPDCFGLENATGTWTSKTGDYLRTCDYFGYNVGVMAYFSAGFGGAGTWSAYAYPIRPIKNTPEVPDSTRTVLYQL